MSFLENILNNIENLVITDELGNEVWSNSEIASKLKNHKSGIIKLEGKYYKTVAKQINISSQKHYLIQYFDISRLMQEENENMNVKKYVNKNEQKS